MQPIINQFIAALLNEEQDTARELLDQYLLMRAKEIHASFANGDSALLSENLDDDIISEQYFTDEDMADHDDATDELSGEMHADDGEDMSDASDSDMDSDMSSDEADMGSDDTDADTGEEEDVDDRVDELEAKLDELTAEFERMMAQLDGDDSDDDSDDVLGSDDETSTSADGNTEMHDDDAEKYPDVEESFTSDREVIKTPNMNGRGTDGKMITQNNKSLPAVRDKTGMPIKSKNVTHNGFDREKEPSSGRLPKGINTQDHASEREIKAAPKGDPKAMINQPVKGNDVSPVAKRKK